MLDSMKRAAVGCDETRGDDGTESDSEEALKDEDAAASEEEITNPAGSEATDSEATFLDFKDFQTRTLANNGIYDDKVGDVWRLCYANLIHASVFILNDNNT